MYIGLQDEHGTPVELVVQKEYYLWGIVPESHTVSLDDEFEELGAVGVAKISYEYRQTWSQWFLGVMTFGMYWPVELRVHGFAKMGDESVSKYSEGRWR